MSTDENNELGMSGGEIINSPLLLCESEYGSMEICPKNAAEAMFFENDEQVSYIFFLNFRLEVPEFFVNLIKNSLSIKTRCFDLRSIKTKIIIKERFFFCQLELPKLITALVIS